MSDPIKALEMLEDINSDVKDMQSRILKIEESKGLSPEDAVSMKEAIGNIESKMTEKDEEYDKLVKALEAEKAKTKMKSELDSTESKRAQCVEFLKGLRAIADQGTMVEQFDTNDFVSVKELMQKAAQNEEMQVKNYVSDDNADGGAAVLPFIDSQIDKLQREYSDVRILASVSTISTDKWEQLKLNQNNGANWEKDMSNFTSNTKADTLSKLNITIENLYAIAIFHKNLISDSAFNLIGEILASMADDFAITEAASFWNGNGNGEMKGIITTADSSGADNFNQIERITSNTSLTWKLEDIYDLIGALKTRYQNRAQFKANRKGITELRKLRSDSGAGTGTGTFLWQPSNIVGVPATLAGYPISQAQELSATPLVAGTEGLVFGDFQAGYRIVDRMGLEVLRDNLTQYPFVAYKCHKRVSGNVQKGEALKILKTKA